MPRRLPRLSLLAALLVLLALSRAAVTPPLAHAAPRTGHEKVILAMGIHSESTCGANTMREALWPKLQEAGLTAKDVYEFSYAGVNSCPKNHRQAKYTPYDTCNSLMAPNGAVAHLQKLVEQVLQDDDDSNIILVGHSLGGVLVTHWAATRTDDYLTKHIKALVTLDSMVFDGNLTVEFDQLALSAPRFFAGQQYCDITSGAWRDIAHQIGPLDLQIGPFNLSMKACKDYDSAQCAIRRRNPPLPAIIPTWHAKTAPIIGQALPGAWRVFDALSQCVSEWEWDFGHGCYAKSEPLRSQLANIVKYSVLDHGINGGFPCSGVWSEERNSRFIGGSACKTQSSTTLDIPVSPAVGISIVYSGDLGATAQLDGKPSTPLPPDDACTQSPYFPEPAVWWEPKRCVVTLTNVSGRLRITTTAQNGFFGAKTFKLDAIDYVPSQVASGTGPVKTVLVLDTSGSMDRASGSSSGGSKLDAAVTGAGIVVDFIEQEHTRHNTPQEMGLVLFNQQPYDLTPLTATFPTIRSKLDQATPSGGTNIYGAIHEGVKLLGPGQPGEPGRSIILLTDGLQEPHRPDEDFFAAGGPVTAAKAAGIAICTIGFGRQGDYNDKLLNRIAADTGCGEMLEAGDEFELQKRFVKLRQRAAGGDIIGEYEGDVGPGETAEAGTFTVSATGQRLNVTLVWPGSTLDLILTDPKGKRIDATTKGASIVTSATTANIIIDNPAKGSWRVQTFGREVSQPREPFYAVVSTRPLPKNTAIPPPSGGGSALPVALGLGTALLAFGLIAFAIVRAREGGAGRDGSGGAGGAEALTLAGPGGVAITLRPGVHLLGREEDCDILLQDDTVSRLHARLTVEQGRLYVEDLGSTGGTYINGRPAPRGVAYSGDTLRVGGTELRVL